jgi:hypothetical protein
VTPSGLRVRLATFGLGLGLALGFVAPAAPAAPPSAPRATRPTIYHKSRSFRIPFNVDPADRPRLREVQLWVSDDSGFTWKTVSRTTPDRPSFTFRAARDAEYWFAVRTLDTTGKLYPGEDEQVEPSMKVVVDTKEPFLSLEPDGRRGSVASVRWEVRDEHLDLSTLVLKYQVEGARDWRQVPIRQRRLIGSESWDAGTAEPLKIRAEVADKADNKAETEITLPEGVPANPALSSNESEFSAPPPIARISSGPNFPPPDDSAPGQGGSDVFGSPPMANAGHPAGNAPEFDPDAFAGMGNGGASPAPGPNAEVAAAPAPAPAPGPAAAAGGGRTLLVASPQFALQYAVDDAGPNGPAVVELWVTQDGGRTWIRRGEDPDRISPFVVDLGGEGTFGLALVARGASGLGDPPPAPGDPPQMWVEVDGTPPHVQLNPPQVGHGVHLGKVAITWRATDLHLGPQPVVISWRPADQPNARWQPITDRIENTGKFIWTVPPNVPPRFHIRIDVVDTVGNRGSAETTDMGPIVVDRARPRSRILGLDPNMRTGSNTNPAARPLR